MSGKSPRFGSNVNVRLPWIRSARFVALKPFICLTNSSMVYFQYKKKQYVFIFCRIICDKNLPNQHICSFQGKMCGHQDQLEDCDLELSLNYFPRQHDYNFIE